MEPKSYFISALKSAIEDERRRWWIYYFAVLMVGTAVSAIDVTVLGWQSTDLVASHPWARPLDRCFFVLMPALAIVAVAFWIVLIWKTSRAEIPAKWFWILFLIMSCSPFGSAKHWLGRLPWAAELASNLREVLVFPLPFVLVWICVVGYRQAQEASKKEVEAYIARRASNSRDVADHAMPATLAGEVDRSGA
jgi:hypothetical protein